MRLANSVGIIDAGYRGDLIAAIDTIGIFGSTDIWHIWNETLAPVKKYDRYFQVCAPDLSPFLVHLVETEQELSPPTERENRPRPTRHSGILAMNRRPLLVPRGNRRPFTRTGICGGYTASIDFTITRPRP